MTDDLIALQALLEKSSDSDLPRDMICFSAHRLMELEVEGLTGAAYQSTQVKVFNSFSASWIYEVFAEGREVLKGFPGGGKFVWRSGQAGCAARSLAFCRSRHPEEAGAVAA